jgi:N-acyl amino acid synthase of PEP-CTERM/exosortase system
MVRDPHACFAEHLTAEVAVGRAQRHDAFRLRYQVYCLEKGFEDASRFPDGLERDRFDARAVQMLVRHRHSGTAVGAVRLILPDRSARGCSFPFEDLCGYSILERRLDGLAGYARDVAEVSRFAVSRRLLAGSREPDDHCDDAVSRRHHEHFPSEVVALGLIALLFAVSADLGVHHWYAMMEPSLERHLARLGIDFRAVGPAVEHRGCRKPMVARVADALARVEVVNPAFHRLIVEIGNVTRGRTRTPGDPRFAVGPVA